MLRYYVCQNRTKPGSWYVMAEEWADGKRLTHRRVPKAESPFANCDTYENARQLWETLKKNADIEREARRISREKARAADLNQVEAAALPAWIREEFESDIVARASKKKHWQVAKALILRVKLLPAEWESKREIFWEEFHRRGWSPSYIKEIRAWLNRYAKFFSGKLGKAWTPVPAPTGGWASKIRRRYEQLENRRRASGRLSFKLLQSLNLPPPQYRTLFISIAFGLRVDELRQCLPRPLERWRITERGLHVYQVKMERFDLKPAKRWKLIPIKTPEQLQALKYLEAGEFELPSRSEWRARDVRDFRNRRVHLDGGRKEFTPMMRARGFAKSDVSDWLGHKSIDTTTNHYDDPEDDDPFSEAA